ncbi:MAG: hypothetical protein QOF51_3915 [Chloroflexota bacterium]|jgi:hypothetical protein|nr:hypothetical protein [Chloroflexota bacterium]
MTVEHEDPVEHKPGSGDGRRFTPGAVASEDSKIDPKRPGQVWRELLNWDEDRQVLLLPMQFVDDRGHAGEVP